MVALLAPVPREHLISALDTIAEHGKVAFGTRAFEVFATLSQYADAGEVEVLIYESESRLQGGPPKVAWKAMYVGFEPSETGGHSGGMTYRPKTTENYQADNKGHWAAFWEVVALRKLPPEDCIKIASLTSVASGKKLGKFFRPHGPLLVMH